MQDKTSLSIPEKHVQLQLASTPLLAPLRKKPKQTVLDEDTYVQAIDDIIQRDFYPDLPKLRNQLEWLEAEEKNDITKMREIAQVLKTSNSVRGL
jgi:protein DGCR14